MADEQYLVLARKWRPQSFEDVVGQEHVTRTLQNAIRNGRIGHAFLFIGSRGIGKTTTARILAKALNCLSTDGPTAEPCGLCDNCSAIAAGNSLDVMEIDGASNNSVEDVRQIRDNIRMAPSRSRYKIYVIDEVHQLSIAAFNALLKTLEEPPPHAVFILATTEAHKIPATIVSRCQRYDFRRVGLDSLMRLLREILGKENVRCSDEALKAIARAADGGVRDAESILDQLVSYCGDEITFQDVFDVLGLVDWRVLHELGDAMAERDVATILRIVDDVVASGKDLGQFVDEILRYGRNLIVCKTGAPTDIIALPEDEIAAMQQRAERYTLTDLIRMVEQFAELAQGYDTQLAQRTALEALLIRMSKRSVEMSADALLEKLASFAETLDGGARVPAASSTGSARKIEGGAPAIAAELQTSQKIPSRGTDGPPVKLAKGRPSASVTGEPPVPQNVVPPRLHLTNENIAQHWNTLVASIGEHAAMTIGVWLGDGRPLAVEKETLCIAFPPGREKAQASLEKAANREKLQAALQQITDNVTDFRIERAETTDDPGTAHVDETAPPPNQPSPKADWHALESDPRVAPVLDVFKGRIIDVRPLPETRDS